MMNYNLKAKNNILANFNLHILEVNLYFIRCDNFYFTIFYITYKKSHPVIRFFVKIK